MISDIPLKGIFHGALLIAITGGAALVGAQDKSASQPVIKAAAKGGSTGQANPGRHPVVDLLMAERLARYGEHMQDSLALIVAARIKQETGERTAKREFQTTGGEGGASTSGRRDTSVAGLTQRARTMAKGRADIVALANEVESARSRGRAEGPHVATSVIRGGALNALPLQFEGGVLAVVGVSGDGATDLDLFVLDESGKRVCASEGSGDDEICRFTPRSTSTYRIEVKNLGKIANQYLFVSN